MSFWELALIAIIALIVLGPERLPKAARTLGLWVGKAKQGFESIKTEIDRELKIKELQEQIVAQKEAIENDSDLNSLREELQDSVNTITDQSSRINNSLNQTVALDSSPKPDPQSNAESPASDAQDLVEGEMAASDKTK